MVGLFELLRHLCSAAGAEFDPHLAADAVRRAGSENPGPDADRWFAALSGAARELGLRVARVRLTPAEAIRRARPDAPLAVLLSADRPAADGPAGKPHWLLLERGGRWSADARMFPGSDALRRLSRGALAREVGLSGNDEPTDFAVAHLAAAAGGLGGDDHSAHTQGHGHGHDAHAGPAVHRTPLQRLWGLLRPERSDIRAVLLFAVAVGVLNLAIPLTTDALVGFVAFGGLLQPLIVLAAVLCACLVLSGAIRLLQAYLVELLQRRLFVRVAADLAWRLPHVRAEAFDRSHGPELVNRFFEIVSVQKNLSAVLLEGVNLVLSAAAGLVVLAFYHPFLLAFDLVLIGVLFVVIFVLGRGAVRTSLKESAAKYRVAGWLEELARHPGAFKAVGGPELALAQADRLSREYLSARAGHFRIVLRQLGGAALLQAAAGSALLVLGGWLVLENQLTLGQLVAAELIVGIVVSNIAKMGKQLEGWYDLLTAVEKLGHLTELPLEHTGGERAPAADRQAGATGAGVEVRGLSFAYDPHRPVIHGLDLTLKPGERVALSAPNGSGNSTALELLMGLRRPDAGSIRLDGMDLRHLDPTSLRSVAGLVRGADIIEGTIAENVRLGREDISLSEVRSALDAVGLWEDVLELPDGLNTRLSVGGRPLSSGQSRRLTLASALAGRPRLLLVDGLLDDLDPAARAAVTRTLFDRPRDMTLLLVSRLPEITSRCDRTIEWAGPPSAAAHGEEH